VVPEAVIEQGEHGDRPSGEGWFVLNARDSQWVHSDEMGSAVLFEGDSKFQEIGVNIQVLNPGQPNCMYHGEECEENFLVLAGECLLLIEGEQRPLKAWDFVHCPPWTEHVFVGAGNGPCAVLMIGTRGRGEGIIYPVSELALGHGAGVEQETSEPEQAYARFGGLRPGRAPSDALPG
jgi:uncharacterized cupin superfamily protein